MKRLLSIPLLFVIALTVGCGKPAIKLSPEGNAAFYGETFMSAVELAQSQTIALVGQANISKEDVTPAINVFIKIGKGGQDLAAALKIVDESNVTSDKQAAAVRVRAALDAFQVELANIQVRVSSETARVRVAQIITAVKLGAALFDVVQRIAPLLPTPVAGGSMAPALAR